MTERSYYKLFELVVKGLYLSCICDNGRAFFIMIVNNIKGAI